MGDVGGKGRVEPGEDQRRFEIRGKSPKKGQKIFKIQDFENVDIFESAW